MDSLLPPIDLPPPNLPPPNEEKNADSDEDIYDPKNRKKIPDEVNLMFII